MSSGWFVHALGSTTVHIADDEGSLRTRLGQSDLEKVRRGRHWPL